MRLLREPTRFLVVWTVACALPVVLLIANMRPVEPGCREWCDVGSRVATLVIFIIVIVWLAVGGLIVRLYRPKR